MALCQKQPDSRRLRGVKSLAHPLVNLLPSTRYKARSGTRVKSIAHLLASSCLATYHRQRRPGVKSLAHPWHVFQPCLLPLAQRPSSAAGPLQLSAVYIPISYRPTSSSTRNPTGHTFSKGWTISLPSTASSLLVSGDCPCMAIFSSRAPTVCPKCHSGGSEPVASCLNTSWTT